MSRMYLLVNKELSMGKGKIAAQVGHAVSRVTERMVRSRSRGWRAYKNSGGAKIVLKAEESMLRDMIAKYGVDRPYPVQRLWCVHVIDSGRTQIDPGSLTVVGFCPCEKEDAPEEIQKLKLL